MPEDEIERLRAALARAHEEKQSILGRLVQRIFPRFAARTKKRIVVSQIRSDEDKNAA